MMQSQFPSYRRQNKKRLKIEFVFGRVENIVEKGENAGYQHFLFFSKCFSKGLFLKVVKSRDCVVKS